MTSRLGTFNLRTATAIGAALFVLGACATTLEPDGRVESTRMMVDEARSAGASAEELSTAQTLIADAVAAREAGDAQAYDSALRLASLYTELGEVRSQLNEAQDELTEMGNVAQARDTYREAAQTCASDLESARAELRDSELAILAASLGATEIQSTDAGDKLVLQNVTFASGRSALPDGAKQRLGALVGYMTDHQDVSVKVDGYTDSAGGDAANQTLSQARAKAVGDYLTEQGIDAGRIETEGFGEASPIASNDTSAGRAQNRRVEITLRR